MKLNVTNHPYYCSKSNYYYNSILISLHYYPENQGKRAPKARTRKPRNQITTNA